MYMSAMHILSPPQFSVFVLSISSLMVVWGNLKVMRIYFGSWPFGWIWWEMVIIGFDSHPMKVGMHAFRSRWERLGQLIRSRWERLGQLMGVRLESETKVEGEKFSISWRRWLPFYLVQLFCWGGSEVTCIFSRVIRSAQRESNFFN